MTTINATINSLNFATVAKRLDIWADGPISRFELLLDNLTDASQILATNHVVSDIGANGVTLLKGYVDDVSPIDADESAVSNKLVKVSGRNVARPLATLFHIKKYANVYLNTMIDDALAHTGADILPVGGLPPPVPLVDIDFNKSYLLNTFSEATTKVGWDFTVTNNKQLQLWPLSNAPHSGVTLKSIAGDLSSNILKIDSEDRVGFSIANFVRVDAGTVNDHYTEGITNPVTGTSAWIGDNCTVSDETALQASGALSVKATISARQNTWCYLAFPSHNHDYLDFSAVIQNCRVWLARDFVSSNVVHLYAQDDQGVEIVCMVDVPSNGAWTPIDFQMLSIPFIWD